MKAGLGGENCQLALLALFIFVLPIPETIALRYALFAALVLASAFAARVGGAKAAFVPEIRWPVVLLLALTGWLLLQALTISGYQTLALREIKSQWLPSLVAFGLGLFIARPSEAGPRIVSVAMLTMLAQSLFSLLFGIFVWLEEGAFPVGATDWTAGKLEISYLNNLLLAFLAVDLAFRLFCRRTASDLPSWLLYVGIVLVLVSNLAFGARNGIIGSVLLVVSLCLVVVLREARRFGRRRVLAGLGLCVTLAIVLGWSNFQLDVRWQKFSETARLAWDIDTYHAWLDETRFSLPLLADGEEVDASAYLRLAWMRVGTRLVAEYPLGVGYSRNAFGHALRRTEASSVGHSHSGIVDLAVGAGIPGLLLWLGWSFALMGIGLRRYVRQGEARGLILFFIVAGFLGRMLLDSINRDHMLLLFFLLVGLLLPRAATAPDKDARHV